MIEPKDYKKKLTDKIICVMDTETDPFEYDEAGDPVLVKPFSVGFYDGEEYASFWGDHCIDLFFEWLQKKYTPGSLIVMVHNGGRFDFMFCLEWLNEGQSPFMIDGKIVAAHFGGQQFRDSYKLMPFPLAEYKKTEIDYMKFRRNVRDLNRPEIEAYQKDDCFDLYDLVKTFFEDWGDRLTIASTSLPLLNSYHGFELMSESQDDRFRQFFFGGMVRAFEGGIIRTKLQVVDVNAMYPDRMKNCSHPVGNRPSLSSTIGPNTFLICLEAINRGALCKKAEDGSLTFNEPRGEFFTTIHEYEIALKLGLIDVLRIKHCWDFDEATTFDRFVDHFYSMRLHYKEIGDKARALFVKYILNSSYGKFAQDPRRYEEFVINYGDFPTDETGWPDMYSEIDNPGGWRHHSTNQEIFVWARASKNRHRSFKNVATGSSITGAARAKLLMALSQARRPLYCDTDSIICEKFNGHTDPNTLGAWKVEAEGDMIAIAGKKLYAIFSKVRPEKPIDKDDDGIILDPKLGALYCIKKASKGAHLTAAEIYQIANGATVHYVNPVPAFQLDGSAKITRRNIKRTA